MPMRHVQVECEDHEFGMTNRSYLVRSGAR